MPLAQTVRADLAFSRSLHEGEADEMQPNLWSQAD
jgi:hypothetical protein